MMRTYILEELAPNTKLILQQDNVAIVSVSSFDENNLFLTKEELLYATPLGKKINEILPQLYEQDLIEILDGKIIIPYEIFPHLYLEDNYIEQDKIAYNLSEYLPKYSPFFLKIDSYRDLGSPDFQYEYSFYWGVKEVMPERIGCFLYLKSKYYYLEENLYKLLSEIDSFNKIEPKFKNKEFNLLKFAKIKELIQSVNGIELDKHLENENVYKPTKVKLNIVQNDDGISIKPSYDNIDEKSFEYQFDILNEVPKIYDTSYNGQRKRIILEDDIKAVTSHLKQEYTNRKMVDIEDKLKNPRAIFSELEGIDQDIVDYEGYSDRVKGIGEIAFKATIQFNSSGVNFLENLNLQNFSDEKYSEIIKELKPTIIAQTIDNEPIEFEVNEDNIKSIEEAIENQKDTIKINTNSGQEMIVPVSEEIKTFIKDNKSLFSKDVPSEEKKNKIKKYLIIHDNFDEETYSEYRNANEEKLLQYQRPFNLNEFLINKKGESKSLELYDYQKEGVAWLETYYDELHQKGALLADDMGLGKTLQVLTFLAWMIEKKEATGEKIKPILIVAPPILLQNWYEEILRFFKNEGTIFFPLTVLHGEELRRYKKYNVGPENLSHNATLCVDCKNCEFNKGRVCALNRNPLENNRIIITNYDTVKNYQFSLGKIEWSSVILDEAQYIKEPNTAVTYAIKTLKADFKLAMTGTPVENKLLDLWSIMDFASPGLLGSKKEFIQNYDVTNKMTAEERTVRLTSLKQKLKISKFKGLNLINTIPYLIRREKQEYLADKLPIKHDGEYAIRIEAQIPDDMAEIHQALVQQAVETDGKHHLIIIQQLIKLYQHKLLLEKNKKEYSVQDYLSASPKLMATINMLKQIQNKKEKVLIFVTSISMQNILKKVIDSIFDLNVGIINGSINNSVSVGAKSKSARYKILQNFEEKEGFNVLILSPHVAGIGLTILGANHVIHYGRWWNPAKEAQATDRAYRIGQDKEVFVYYPIYKSNCFETFDEKLDRLIEGKRALARDFLTPIEDLEISAKDMLFDLSYDITTPQKTNSTLMNIKNISETEFKTLIYLLMQKEGKQIDYLSEKNSFGVDLIVNNKNGKELYKTFTIEIDELDIDNFILTINKLNKNGCNNIFISTNLAPKVIKYAKENDINIYTQKEIENLIKKHKINQNALLSIIIDKKEIDNI